MTETSPEYGEALDVYRLAQFRLDRYQSDGRVLLGYDDETMAKQTVFQKLVDARNTARNALDVANPKT